jgi:hypothetical protein
MRREATIANSDTGFLAIADTNEPFVAHNRSTGITRQQVSSLQADVIVQAVDGPSERFISTRFLCFACLTSIILLWSRQRSQQMFLSANYLAATPSQS